MEEPADTLNHPVAIGRRFPATVNRRLNDRRSWPRQRAPCPSNWSTMRSAPCEEVRTRLCVHTGGHKRAVARQHGTANARAWVALSPTKTPSPARTVHIAANNASLASRPPAASPDPPPGTPDPPLRRGTASTSTSTVNGSAFGHRSPPTWLPARAPNRTLTPTRPPNPGSQPRSGPPKTPPHALRTKMRVSVRARTKMWMFVRAWTKMWMFVRVAYFLVVHQ